MPRKDTKKKGNRRKKNNNRKRRAELVPVKPKGKGVEFDINPESVTFSGGVGGWTEHERPRRAPAIEWSTRPLKRVSFTLFLDGWPNDPVEGACNRLKNMGQPSAKHSPPPEVELHYGPYRNERWVVESLEWGDELRNGRLERVRQDVTVALMEFSDADTKLSHAKENAEKKGKGKGKDKDEKNDGGGRKVYVVKRGDTLAQLAVKFYDKQCAWRTLAKVNDIRDPQNLKVGQKLRIPKDADCKKKN